MLRKCIIYATTRDEHDKGLGKQNGTFNVGLWHLMNHLKDARHGQSCVMVERLRRLMLGILRIKCIHKRAWEEVLEKGQKTSGLEIVSAEKTRVLKQKDSKRGCKKEMKTSTFLQLMVTLLGNNIEDGVMQVGKLPPADVSFELQREESQPNKEL